MSARRDARIVRHTARTTPITHTSRDGFVLFLAMFVLVIVSGLTLEAGLRARAERARASNAVASLKARAAARAGVAHVLARVRTRSEQTSAKEGVLPDRWLQVGHLTNDRSGSKLGETASYRVDVQDAAARLSLNQATEDELRRFFSALGARAIQADVAAQSVLDWRDEDGLHRARGAEWNDFYRRQEPSVVPRNGPFASLEELRHVRGMDDNLHARAAAHLTLLGDGRVNLNTASEPVLRALAGVTDEVVALLLSRRAVGPPLRNLFELQGAVSGASRTSIQRNFAALARRASFETTALEITSTGSTTTAPVRSTVHALAVRGGRTFQVVWSVER